MAFAYQDMDVYHIAMGFVDSVANVLKQFPLPRPTLLEKLDSMAIQIPLTLARVNGRVGDALMVSDLLEIRAVVYECLSLIEILWRRKLISDKESEDLNNPLTVMANLLTR